MTLLESLLDAIVRLEGDALVMHVGEKPYVVTTSSSMNAYRGPLAWGQVELSSRVLTCEAVLSMVGQIIPPDQRQALDDLGAIEHEIAPPPGIADRFSIVAARGGDDIWLELRRHPVVIQRPLEAQPAAAEAPAAVAEAGTSSPVDAGAAVGLQESPHADDVDEVEELEVHTLVESSISDPTIEETTIEERVPVLDEVGSQEPERVEHIRIPVDTQEPTEEHALEVVDPEPQDAPTDADVDAMLAATAGTLLTEGLEDRAPGEEPPDWVILDDGEAERERDAEMSIVAEPDSDAGDSRSRHRTRRDSVVVMVAGIERGGCTSGSGGRAHSGAGGGAGTRARAGSRARTWNQSPCRNQSTCRNRCSSSTKA